MFTSPEHLTLQLLAVAFSLGLLAATELFPRAARALYMLLFAWACAVNWHTALTRPVAYLEYADLAVLPVYREFIRGWFAGHVLPMVGTIATCQGLIAAGLVIGGRLARYALLGAAVFLVMITPLGVGSGFPSTLLMAAGCYRLLRAGPVLERSIPAQVLQSLRKQSPRKPSPRNRKPIASP